jgi:hypothetical protein
MGVSLGIVEIQLTAQAPNLAFEFDDDDQMRRLE